MQKCFTTFPHFNLRRRWPSRLMQHKHSLGKGEKHICRWGRWLSRLTFITPSWHGRIWDISSIWLWSRGDVLANTAESLARVSSCAANAAHSGFLIRFFRAACLDYKVTGKYQSIICRSGSCSTQDSVCALQESISQSCVSSRNQSWIFIGKTDVEAETPNTLATWSEELTHLKRSWCWERLKAGGEGMTEDEMVGWHHWLNGHEFE